MLLKVVLLFRIERIPLQKVSLSKYNNMVLQYKRAIVLHLLCWICLLGYAQEVTIHVEEAGTLSTYIDASKKNQVKNLIITGYLNGFDVYYIRHMDGLETLDMTNCLIIEGGAGYKTENNTIGYQHFTGCKQLKKVKLPSSALYIKYQAFDQAYMLESVEIGESLIEIHDQAFVNDMNAYGHATRTCKKMKEFIVSEKNKKFAAVNGVLFNKEKTELLFYPNAKSKTYAIPEGVVSIRQRAFSVCDNLFNLEIPESVNSIGRGVFENCNHLMSIYCYNPVPPTAESSTASSIFYGVDLDACILYVPEGSYSSYWLAPAWGRLKNIVEFDPTTAIRDVQNKKYTIQVIEGGLSVWNLPEDVKVAVYSVNGTLVYSGDGGVISLNSGIYIVRIGSEVTKVVVQ